MWTIIIGLIVLGIIINILGALSKLVGGPGILISIIVVFVIAFLAFSWEGVFAVIGVAIALALVFFIVRSVVSGIENVGLFIGNTINTHDKEKKETAKIKKQTQSSKEMHENEKMLKNELDQNCRWLGFMNEKMWHSKLPNYVNKQYSTSFTYITDNFARQMEEQNIKQNDDWFQPFLMYLIAHPQGATVTKMLNEVICPQFHATHVTSNGDLLNTQMVKGTERVNKDVPPLFNKNFIGEMNESLFTPTKYALKLYGDDNSSSGTINRTNEISFDEL